MSLNWTLLWPAPTKFTQFMPARLELRDKTCVTKYRNIIPALRVWHCVYIRERKLKHYRSCQILWRNMVVFIGNRNLQNTKNAHKTKSLMGHCWKIKFKFWAPIYSKSAMRKINSKFLPHIFKLYWFFLLNLSNFRPQLIKERSSTNYWLSNISYGWMEKFNITIHWQCSLY